MNPQSKKMVMMQKILNPSQYRLSNSLSTLNKENYIRVMSESIHKAVNSEEGPVKEKHVRRLLIASFQFESAQFFWDNLPVIRLKENQIVCWKFCNVLHKLIRDGHRQALISCSDRRQLLLDCGNLWRHVQTGYGKLIHAYCELLFDRIRFHTEFSSFPNDLRLTEDELDALSRQDNSSNLLYELCVQILDSIDAITNLSDKVLDSTTSKHLSSTSHAGRCHLAPLVACIQDASLFYDIAVKILFRLHARLSGGFMQFLRERFGKCHEGMRDIFSRVRNLQYFKNLIQIPQLSDKPPNFLVAAELEQHVSPQVIMIAESVEHESPEHGLLVKLDDDDAEDVTSTIADDSESTFSSLTQNQLQQQQHHLAGSEASTSMHSSARIDSLLNSATAEYGPLDGLMQTHSEEAASKLRDQVRELERQLEDSRSELKSVQSELGRVKEAYEQLKLKSSNEIEMLGKELSVGKSKLSQAQQQLHASELAYEKLMAECERAKHDNDISQVAMKRLVKEMSELKMQQSDQLQKVRDDVSRENDAREEDRLMEEMNETDKIIKEATRKIEELSEKSRKVESGIKLQVNEKISEVCSNLMKAVRNLIAQSRLLQKEIVSQAEGGSSGTINKDEFYKRNSSWTEGLISAAIVVALAARSLVDAADRTMTNQARFSELAAAAHEVGAATTQLVVASRVKANKDSEKLKVFTSAAKQVNQCTANVVTASKVCSEMVEQELNDIDISTLSLHQTKKLEMETQVRLLELEQSLTRERTKLGLLRRQHYEQEDAQAHEATNNSK